MANNVGREANSISRLCFTLVKVMTPMAPRTPLPTKFAAAEKHKVRHLPAMITPHYLGRQTISVKFTGDVSRQSHKQGNLRR